MNNFKINILLSIIGIATLSGCSTTHSNKRTPAFNNGTKTDYSCDYKQPQSKSGSFYKTDGPLELPSNLDDILNPIPILEPFNKGNSKPYYVLGQSFTPISNNSSYKETGLATWYGRRYHGQKTANGETYDMFKMTAASPILPIPSYATVKNLRNGRSVIVRINDRGPFLKSRIIDLSFLAACRLGYATQGMTDVEVTRIFP
ncbi:septal ring lytic transglycosylase RlpA family protein [archaeon]|nr:septal ring lytic transglycosylase RlpA family protein [archaeon]NCQ52321.1 septal ring lytic transglycosylase RlpA family protein [archaeon]